MAMRPISTLHYATGQPVQSQTAMRNIITTGIFTFSLLLVSQLLAATDLSSLSPDARTAISRLCSPVQYREGAAAYRRCVQSEIQSQQQGGTSKLTALSFDDKYAVQQFCATAGDSHQACVNNQIAAARNTPAPSMNNIADDEQYAIQQSCFSAQSTQGLLAYRQCVNNEVASLQQLPRINLNAMPVLERNALQLRCSANSGNASAYRQCLAVEFSSFSNAAPTYDTTTTAEPAIVTAPAQKPVTAVQVATANEAPQKQQQVTTTAEALPVATALPRSIDPQRATQTQGAAPAVAALPTTDTAAASTTTTLIPAPAVTAPATADTSATLAATTVETPAPVTEPRVITKPKLVEQVAQIETDLQSKVEPEAAPGAGLLKLLSSTTESIREKFNSLTALGKAVAGAALALPLLLLALRKLVRRRRNSQRDHWEQNYQAQQESSTINRNNNRSTEAIKARWDEDFLNDETLPTEPYVPQPTATAANQIVQETTDAASVDSTATRIIQRPSQHTAPVEAETRWQSGFGKWLDSEAIADRQQHCTEFLIYWMAYGDERYEKGLKERIFTEPKPNQHDLIKRWVLKQDIFAFADTINWLKRNSSKIQQEQILDLLMALLVTENNITPNQNVILRMLADSFGIGNKALQERFKYTFAQDLPAFPRTDKQSWWSEQSAETTMRWDARQLATLPEAEQMLSRLGLNENYTESDVVKSFRRAAKRCHPDRFSHLGNWEQMLAQRQFERFEEARDKLLGVSV